jgi:hypothetical protein
MGLIVSYRGHRDESAHRDREAIRATVVTF